MEHPDRVQIEYNQKGKCSGTKIEKKFDVLIGFPQTSGYFPLPTCSVIKFELDPATQSKYYCEGKLTVLMRYTLSQDYTLQNVTGKVFHQFTNSPLPNHAHCFYNRQKTALDGNRKNPIEIFQHCNLPNCTCQLQQPPPQTKPPQTNSPQTNLLQTQYLLQVGMGDKPKTKEVPKVGTGDKPKTKEVPNVGMGDKPKTKEVPKVGMGDKPKTKEVPKVATGDKPKTKEVPKVGTGGKPKTKEVPNVGVGDKPKTKEVPKVGMGDKPKTKEVPNMGMGDKPKKKRRSQGGDRENPKSSLRTTPTKKHKI